MTVALGLVSAPLFSIIGRCSRVVRLICVLLLVGTNMYSTSNELFNHFEDITHQRDERLQQILAFQHNIAA